MLTKTQLKRIKKSANNGTGTDLRISKSQIGSVVHMGGNLLGSIFSLGTKNLPKKKRDEISVAVDRLFGGSIVDTIGDTAAEDFFEHGIPWLAKQGVKQGRYFASEFLREPKYQKKIANKANQSQEKLLITQSML